MYRMYVCIHEYEVHFVYVTGIYIGSTRVSTMLKTYLTGPPFWLTLQQQNLSSRTLRERLARHAIRMCDWSVNMQRMVGRGLVTALPRHYLRRIAAVQAQPYPVLPVHSTLFVPGCVPPRFLSEVEGLRYRGRLYYCWPHMCTDCH